MTDIFLSYKREDEARVERLAEALEKTGFKTWWDRGLPAGESWRANIQRALDEFKCVIVCWTHRSTGQAGDFVRDEATQAKARGILVPVLLARGVRAPLGFGELQAVDLTNWHGSTTDPFFRDLIAAIRAKLEGRAAPPPKGPMARLTRRFTVASMVTAAIAGVFAIAANFMNVQNHVCGMPIGQPLLSDTCGALGIGEKPTRRARLAFEALPPGDCGALQAFRDAHEDSPLRIIADSRLNAKTTTDEEVWVPRERRLVLFAGGVNEREARTAAGAQAERLCRGFAAATSFRLSTAEVSGAYSCAGGACGFFGEAVCRLSERHIVTREACGQGQ